MENSSNSSPANALHMYSDMASWWTLLSAPEDYAEEAAFFKEVILEFSNKPVQTVLELGSGGGSNASFLKHSFRMTLVDLSAQMLAVSQKLNPECEHLQGDMRTVALGRIFDAVFIHDAVMYMTSLRDLRNAITTAYEHCREEGVVVIVPDFTRETFKPSTEYGGHDAKKKGMRYLAWTYDPDPEDSTCISDYAYLLRDKHGQVQCTYDRHVMGLFSQQEWLNVLSEVGFDPKILQDPFERKVFVGVKCGV